MAGRVGRVLTGLARPGTRPAYVAAIRRRVSGKTAERTYRGERCLVCGAARPKVRDIASDKQPERVCSFHVCGSCGYVGNPGNLHDYRQFTDTSKLPLRARVGTAERKGREFHMAKMATSILGRRNLEVIVFGAGRSFDNHHIEAFPQVRKVAVADIMKVRDDAEFIDLNEPAPRRFPLVLASEVVEHFLEPRKDFEYLFSFVEADGLLVCSTNIYDGGSIAKQPYIFIPGHVSYYTPRALQVLAAANGFHVDFRAPLVATGYGGPRKRYVLFSKSRAVMDAVPLYFGSHLFAPSEGPRANVELAEQIAREQRESELRQAELRRAASGDIDLGQAERRATR